MILAPAFCENANPTVSIDVNYPAIGSGAEAAFRKHVQQLTQFMQTECGTAMTIRMDKTGQTIY